MKRAIFILAFSFTVFFLIFFKIQFVLIRLNGERIVYITPIKDGDLIEIAHINSIYEKEVREILKVNHGNMELAHVITESFGIKEYYRIDDEPRNRKWGAISFYNSEGRNFSLKIKGKEVDLKKFVNRSLRVEISRMSVLSFLLLIFSGMN